MDFAERIHSVDFARQARHPEFPHAFTRARKLPLPALIAALLAMRGQSQQVMLDGFFSALCCTPELHRGISDRAFAKARDHLHLPCLEGLNQWLVAHADAAGAVGRWRGLRVVAADASVLKPGLRKCLLKRSAADPDQRLFALFLPGSELTLHASVHSAAISERAMLMEALDALGPDDVLVLDRGYPAAWLVAVLQARGIRYCMRCDNPSGWAAGKAFLRSDADEQWVELNAPNADDVRDWGCPKQAPTTRLVRQVAPNGQLRLLATNLSATEFPVAVFGPLYHQRWRIEEAFKRLKHRLKLESVSGLSQHALIIDVAAKVLADNLAALMAQSDFPSHADADAAPATAQKPRRRCNRAYASNLLQRALPSLILFIGDFAALLNRCMVALRANTQAFRPGRSQPRPMAHVKPHPANSYKG